MVLFGLDMNLLPVMGRMGTSHTKHSNLYQPRFVCHALDVSLFLLGVSGGRTGGDAGESWKWRALFICLSDSGAEA